MDNLIGERIKEGLRLRGLKQADLVKKTGINKGALSSYISGKYKPKQSSIFKIATALDIAPDWLMGFTDVIRTKEEVFQQLTSKENEYLIFPKDQFLDSNDSLFKAKANLGFLDYLLEQKKIDKKTFITEKNKILNNLLENKLISNDEYKSETKDD